MILIRLKGLVFDGEVQDYGPLIGLTRNDSLIAQIVAFLKMYTGIASRLREGTHGLMLTPRDVAFVVDAIMQPLIGGMQRRGEEPALDVELQAGILTPAFEEIGLIVQPLCIPSDLAHPERGTESCALVIKRA